MSSFSNLISLSRPFLLLLVILCESVAAKTDNIAKVKARGRGTLKNAANVTDASNVRVAKEPATS
ncbi:hypothetical protein [Wolbachia endosymbiont of Wuchereria bancrofti]|uniref:hypothetical protein n=1 Tax=Wolbachia endosymbiont of Wuchereria bancrofti TaxID=96496 RepID=UPI000B4D795A|nr:hypothetical protein [Wolbachia endosymbiont of Wuchereria bancrofti]